MNLLQIGFIIQLDDQIGTITSTNVDKFTVKNNETENEYIEDDLPLMDILSHVPQESPILTVAKAKFNHFFVRRKSKLHFKIGFNNQQFFYGFAESTKMLHFEKAELNHPMILQSSLYYQAGDYSNLLLHQGKIEFGETYNRSSNGDVGDFMIGLACKHDKGPRFYKWCYGSKKTYRPLYNLYLLLKFGSDYYIFRGKTKEEIMQCLLSNETIPSEGEVVNPHIYQAFAHVLYYNEDIPESYGLPSLKEKILTNLTNRLFY